MASDEQLMMIGGGSIKLFRLDPGQSIPTNDASSETQLALVLEGACQNDSGTYVRGDIIEWTEDSPHRPVIFGTAECVCLMADESAAGHK